jgi:hypothetical protein
MERKTLEEERKEFRRYLEEVSRPKAEVKDFPPKLAEAERHRVALVLKQDRERREAYEQRLRNEAWEEQKKFDGAWQANLDRWAEEKRRQQTFHRGPGDSDWSA